MRFITPLTSIVALLLAPVLSMPLEMRSSTASELASELSALTLSSSYLQIYTANGGAAMDVDAYSARWTSFNDAATTVADGLAGVPALSADDKETVNRSFQTFSATHVTTLGQLSDVAGTKLSAGGKKTISGAVSSNRDKITTISNYLGDNKGLRSDRKFSDSTSQVDNAFASAIEALA